MMDAESIALRGLELGAIKLSPDDPFTWASGYRMPIYNDNRMFLFNAHDRDYIIDAFNILMDKTSMDEGLSIDTIAGTSTAGIPWGAFLSDLWWGLNFVYVRDKPKDHGLRNQIEGIDSNSDLRGHSVALIEDLISTGGSSARAVQAIRDAQGECNYCFSIFDYGLDKAREAFDALNPSCTTKSLLTYDTLLRVAKDRGYINPKQEGMLEEWRIDPFRWGEKHGFPRVEK